MASLLTHLPGNIHAGAANAWRFVHSICDNIKTRPRRRHRTSLFGKVRTRLEDCPRRRYGPIIVAITVMGISVEYFVDGLT